MFRSIRLAIPPIVLVALSACATTPPPPTAAVHPAQPAPVAAAGQDPTSGYGLFLAGQLALEDGDSQSAADFFAKAGAATQDAAFLKERVFTAALLAGDVTRAAAMAPGPDESTPSVQALGVVTKAVDELADGRGREAFAELSQPQPAVAYLGPGVLLKAWAAASNGQWTDALTMPSSDDRLIQLVAGLDQAMLYERAHRYAEAETAYKAMISRKIGLGLIAPAYGVFLERRHRYGEAVTVYDQSLAAEPDDGPLLAARARAAARKPAPPQPTIREGAAQALIIPAGAILADKQSEIGLIYLRLVLRLDPGRDDAWLLAGQAMASAGDTRSARAAYEQVGPKSGRWVDARSQLAWSYQPEDKEAALKIARDAVAAKPDSETAPLTLADLLRADERFEESASVLAPLIAAKNGHADWRLYYMRGVALERAGHWPDAERDLNQALTLRPDQPEILNYLGYSWVNRGAKVQQGMAMIQKAVDAQPDEGAYVDSLGWAYYRLGDYRNAVETLERAVMMEAGDAEINDHLGDAYWRIGRKVEAQFQWRAVLTLEPDAEVKARAEAKLASPLGPDAVAKTAATAS